MKQKRGPCFFFPFIIFIFHKSAFGRQLLAKEVHFVRKKTRDQILKQYFNTRLKMDNMDTIVLKEIPIIILCKRKDCLLTEKLKQKIPFWLDKLEGIIFTFKWQQFRLISVQKAREFFERFKRGVMMFLWRK